MFFKKSNKFYEENVFIKDTIETVWSKAEVCASALFYMEYRLNYEKNCGDQSDKCAKCLEGLYNDVEVNFVFESYFLGKEDFKRKVSAACARNGWRSMMCVVDSLRLGSGPSGRMGFQRKAEILGIFKKVLEQYYGLPVSRILRRVNENSSD